MTMSPKTGKQFPESFKSAGGVEVVENIISKSRFKPHALQYYREVEQTGNELIITDRGNRF